MHIITGIKYENKTVKGNFKVIRKDSGLDHHLHLLNKIDGRPFLTKNCRKRVLYWGIYAVILIIKMIKAHDLKNHNKIIILSQYEILSLLAYIILEYKGFIRTKTKKKGFILSSVHDLQHNPWDITRIVHICWSNWWNQWSLRIVRSIGLNDVNIWC